MGLARPSGRGCPSSFSSKASLSCQGGSANPWHRTGGIFSSVSTYRVVVAALTQGLLKLWDSRIGYIAALALLSPNSSSGTKKIKRIGSHSVDTNTRTARRWWNSAFWEGSNIASDSDVPMWNIFFFSILWPWLGYEVGENKSLERAIKCKRIFYFNFASLEKCVISKVYACHFTETFRASAQLCLDLEEQQVPEALTN